MQVESFYFLSCSKSQSRLQVDEIHIFSTFLVSGHLKFTHALSTSKIKVLIHQFFNVKVFLNTIAQIKNTFNLLLIP